MSEENYRDLSHHDHPFGYDHHEIIQSSFPFFSDNPFVYNQPVAPPQNQQWLDPSYNMSFTDCLHGSVDYKTLSRAFDMSCSPSSPIDDNLKKAGVGESAGTAENLSTANSSVSCSSNEGAGDEESAKSEKEKQPQGREDGDEEKSKKV